jgi:O-antigen ligase
VNAGVLVLIAWVSLVPYRFLAFDQPLVMLANFLPLLLTVGLAGLLILFRRRAVVAMLQADVLLGAIVALVLADLLSAVGGVNILHSLPRVAYYFLTGPLVYWVVSCVCGTASRQKSILIAVSAFSGLASLYGISEYLVGESWLFSPFLSVANLKFAVATGGAEFANRVLGTVGHPVTFGAFLLLSLPASIYLADEHSHLRWLGISAAIAAVTAIALTFSRGAWISLTIAAVTWGTRRQAGQSNRAALWRVLAAGVLLVAMAAAVLMTRGTYGEFVQGFHQNPRVLAYSHTAILLPDHLFAGSGTGTFRWLGKPLGSRLDMTDNMYLTRLVEGGVMGLAALLCLLIQIGRRLKTLPLDRNRETLNAHTISQLFFAVLLGAAVDMMIFDLLSIPSTRVWFWIQVAIVMAVIRGPDRAPVQFRRG